MLRQCAPALTHNCVQLLASEPLVRQPTECVYEACSSTKCPCQTCPALVMPALFLAYTPCACAPCTAQQSDGSTSTVPVLLQQAASTAAAYRLCAM